MNENNQKAEIKLTLETLLSSEVTEALRARDTMTEVSYHELADIPVQSVDLFEQLESNLQTLSDLQKRMKFVMSEVRYQMKL